jgi:hypothetical protein
MPFTGLRGRRFCSLAIDPSVDPNQIATLALDLQSQTKKGTQI